MTLTQMAQMLDERKPGDLRYLPILKARQGELKALESLDGPVRPDLTPIIELVENFEGLSSSETGVQLDKLAAKIVRAWPPGRPRIVVDTFSIELDAEAPSWGIHGEPVEPELLTGPLLDRLRSAGLRAVPVIRLSDQPGYTQSLVERIGLDPEPGACLRIGGEDLDDTVVPLEQAVEELLDEYDVDPRHVDLILDFGAVTDDNTLAMASRLARFVLPSLDRQPWRSFSLSDPAHSPLTSLRSRRTPSQRYRVATGSCGCSSGP